MAVLPMNTITAIDSAKIFFDRIVEKLVGSGRRIVIVDALMDPDGGYEVFLTCERHRTSAKVCHISGGIDEISHAEIVRAAGECAPCAAALLAILPPTRWPEGAEL